MEFLASTNWSRHGVLCDHHGVSMIWLLGSLHHFAWIVALKVLCYRACLGLAQEEAAIKWGNVGVDKRRALTDVVVGPALQQEVLATSIGRC